MANQKMKTRLLIIIGIVIFTISITSSSIVYNQEIKLITRMMQSDSEPSDRHPTVLNTVICQDAISNWLDVSDRLDPVPKDITVREDLFRQKNDATLTLLNHCNVESLSVDELQNLRHVEIDDEN